MLLMNRLAPLSAFSSRAQVMSSASSSSVASPVSLDTQRSGKVVFENYSLSRIAYFNFLAKHLTGQSFTTLGETQQGMIQSLAQDLKQAETKRDITFHHPDKDAPIKNGYFSFGGTPVELPKVYDHHSITERIETFFANINTICNG